MQRFLNYNYIFRTYISPPPLHIIINLKKMYFVNKSYEFGSRKRDFSTEEPPGLLGGSLGVRDEEHTLISSSEASRSSERKPRGCHMHLMKILALVLIIGIMLPGQLLQPVRAGVTLQYVSDTTSSCMTLVTAYLHASNDRHIVGGGTTSYVVTGTGTTCSTETEGFVQEYSGTTLVKTLAVTGAYTVEFSPGVQTAGKLGSVTSIGEMESDCTGCTTDIMRFMVLHFAPSDGSTAPTSDGNQLWAFKQSSSSDTFDLTNLYKQVVIQVDLPVQRDIVMVGRAPLTGIEPYRVFSISQEESSKVEGSIKVFRLSFTSSTWTTAQSSSDTVAKRGATGITYFKDKVYVGGQIKTTVGALEYGNPYFAIFDTSLTYIEGALIELGAVTLENYYNISYNIDAMTHTNDGTRLGQVWAIATARAGTAQEPISSSEESLLMSILPASTGNCKYQVLKVKLEGQNNPKTKSYALGIHFHTTGTTDFMTISMLTGLGFMQAQDPFLNYLKEFNVQAMFSSIDVFQVPSSLLANSDCTGSSFDIDQSTEPVLLIAANANEYQTSAYTDYFKWYTLGNTQNTDGSVNILATTQARSYGKLGYAWISMKVNVEKSDGSQGSNTDFVPELNRLSTASNPSNYYSSTNQPLITLFEYYDEVRVDGAGSIIARTTNWLPSFNFHAPTLGFSDISSATVSCYEDVKNMNSSLTNFTLINIAVDNSAGSWPNTVLAESRFFDAYSYIPDCGTDPTTRALYYKEEWDTTKSYTVSGDLPTFTAISGSAFGISLVGNDIHIQADGSNWGPFTFFYGAQFTTPSPHTKMAGPFGIQMTASSMDCNSATVTAVSDTKTYLFSLTGLSVYTNYASLTGTSLFTYTQNTATAACMAKKFEVLNQDGTLVSSPTTSAFYLLDRDNSNAKVNTLDTTQTNGDLVFTNSTHYFFQLRVTLVGNQQAVVNYEINNDPSCGGETISSATPTQTVTKTFNSGIQSVTVSSFFTKNAGTTDANCIDDSLMTYELYTTGASPTLLTDYTYVFMGTEAAKTNKVERVTSPIFYVDTTTIASNYQFMVKGTTFGGKFASAAVTLSTNCGETISAVNAETVINLSSGSGIQSNNQIDALFNKVQASGSCIQEADMKYEIFTNQALTTLLTDFSVLYFDGGTPAPQTATAQYIKPILKTVTTNSQTGYIVYIKATTKGQLTASVKITTIIGCGAETISGVTQAAASVDLGIGDQTIEVESMFTKSAIDANCIAQSEMKYELFTNQALTVRLTNYAVMGLIGTSGQTNTVTGINPQIKFVTDNLVSNFIVYIKATTKGLQTASVKYERSVVCGKETIASSPAVKFLKEPRAGPFEQAYAVWSANFVASSTQTACRASSLMKFELFTDETAQTLLTDFSKVYFVETTSTPTSPTPSPKRRLAAPAVLTKLATLDGKEGKLVMELANRNYAGFQIFLKATTGGGRTAIQSYTFSVKDCLLQTLTGIEGEVNLEIHRGIGVYLIDEPVLKAMFRLPIKPNCGPTRYTLARNPNEVALNGGDDIFALVTSYSTIQLQVRTNSFLTSGTFKIDVIGYNSADIEGRKTLNIVMLDAVQQEVAAPIEPEAAPEPAPPPEPEPAPPPPEEATPVEEDPIEDEAEVVEAATEEVSETTETTTTTEEETTTTTDANTAQVASSSQLLASESADQNAKAAPAPGALDPELMKALLARQNPTTTEKKRAGGTIPKFYGPPVSVEVSKVEVTRKGKCNLPFNKKMKLPSWLITEPVEEIFDDRRALQQGITIDQIDAARDILDISFIIKSDIEVDDIKYTVKITQWTEYTFDFALNFTNPEVISQGIERDTLYIKIKAPELFVTEEGEQIDVSRLVIRKTLPRQLPKNIKQEDLQNNANTVSQALESLVYIQLGLQFFMKGGIQDLLDAFYIIQFCCFFTIYTPPMPSNAEIYIGEFRKLISFDAVKPDKLLQRVDPDYSVAYFMNIGQEKLTGAIESSGIESSNFLYNMSTYLFMIAAFFAVLIGLWLLSVCKSTIQDRIKAKYEQLKKKFFFNGKIKAWTVSYLKTCISFSVLFPKLDWGTPFDKLYPQLIPLLIIFGWPLTSVFVLWYFRERLETPQMRQKISGMYNNIHLKKNRWTIFYYPIFLIRRFVFVLIPFFLMNFQGHQVQLLLFINLFTCMFYFYVKPHILPLKVKQEMFNEYMVLILSYHMFTFTQFVIDVSIQFVIGYSFVAMLCIILFVNVLIMVRNQIKRFFSQRRKMANQTIYEIKFKKFHEIEKQQYLNRAEIETAQFLEKKHIYAQKIFKRDKEADSGSGSDTEREEENKKQRIELYTILEQDNEASVDYTMDTEMQEEMEALIDEELNKVDYQRMLNQINSSMSTIKLDIKSSIKESYMQKVKEIEEREDDPLPLNKPEKKKKPKVDDREGFVITTKEKVYQGMSHMQKESWSVLKTYCNSVRKMTEKEKLRYKKEQVAKLVRNRVASMQLGDQLPSQQVLLKLGQVFPFSKNTKQPQVQP